MMTTHKNPESKLLLLTPSSPDVETILSGITHIHAQCILHDGQLVTFLPPLSYSKMLRSWQNILEEVPQNNRHIIVELRPVSKRTADVSFDKLFEADLDPSPALPVVSMDDISWDIAGVVSLKKPESETGPMRGLVHRLLTSPNHRQTGVARNLMRELERLARIDGRWSLLLDTTVGTSAEMVYPKLGYNRMGVVEGHGISPATGEIIDEVWFWKDLRRSAPI